MKEITFEAEILPGARGGALVELPFDPKVELGSARARVVATFDGHEYRGSVAVMGGTPLIGVRSDVRAAINKQIGDRVAVVIRLDDQPRTIQVPDDLARSLEAVGLSSAFDALSYTARREAAESVTGAKRPETRERRIAKIIGGLSDG